MCKEHDILNTRGSHDYLRPVLIADWFFDVCLMGGLYPAAEILGPISIPRGSRLRWSIAVVGIYVSDRCAVKFVNVLCKNGTFYSGFIEHKNDRDDTTVTLLNINAREYRRNKQKWTIQRNWQQDEEKQIKNTTQYVLDTTLPSKLSNKTVRIYKICISLILF